MGLKVNSTKLTLRDFTYGNQLFPYVDARKWCKRLWHILQAIFREIAYNIRAAFKCITYYNIRKHKAHLFCKLQKNSTYSSDNFSWNQKKTLPSTGLYVFLHGFRSSPYHWAEYLEQIQKNQPNADYFVPFIKNKGNDSLEEVAEPVLNAVQDYHSKHPDLPVCLVSFSNGTRVAGYVERKSMLEKRAIKTISIAGVHFGTKLMDKLEKCKLLKCQKFHPSIVKDFKFGSAAAKKYLDDWRKADSQAVGKRSREFFASTNDHAVFNFRSSLPIINAVRDKHIILHGHSHHSIFGALQKRVLKSCQDWMQQNQPVIAV